MRRFFCTLLSLVLLFSLTSCGAKKNTEKPETNKQQIYSQRRNNNAKGANERNVEYIDGVYEGEGNVWKYGKEEATVVIREGRITCIVLRKLDANGKEVNYDEWTGEEINGTIRPNLKEYRLILAERMLEAQTYDVPPIEGAGVSSESWKLAVKRALQKAKRR